MEASRLAQVWLDARQNEDKTKIGVQGRSDMEDGKGQLLIGLNVDEEIDTGQ